MAAIDDLSSQRFYHGTKTDLKPGDLIEPGYHSNYGKRGMGVTFFRAESDQSGEPLKASASDDGGHAA